MAEENKKVTDSEEIVSGAISDEDLEQISGGTMRGKIVITPTTDISDDTRRNI